MKTKTFLLLCLLLGIGLTQLSAQSQFSDDNRALSYDEAITWWTPVFCDGIQVDFLTADLVWHITAKSKMGFQYGL